MQMITYHLWLDNIKDVIKALEEIAENPVNWFSNNEMKLNTDECHLLLNSQELNMLKIRDLHIKRVSKWKTTGHKFVCKLKFTRWRYLPKSITETKCTCKAFTIHGNNQSIFFWMRFSSNNLIVAHQCTCATMDL